MEDLKNYIKSSQESGMSNSEIKNALVTAGWDARTIEQYLGSEVPTPPRPQNEDRWFKDEDFQMLNPKAVYVLMWRQLNQGIFLIIFFGIMILPGALIDFFDQRSAFAYYMLLFYVVFALFFIGIALLLGKLEYRFYKYALTSKGFQKEHGVISKKYVTIPYTKIQNIDIHQNLLERILGLYRISIQTAGQGGFRGEGILPGLVEEEANRVRNELLKRASINN